MEFCRFLVRSPAKPSRSSPPPSLRFTFLPLHDFRVNDRTARVSSVCSARASAREFGRPENGPPSGLSDGASGGVPLRARAQPASSAAGLTTSHRAEGGGG